MQDINILRESTNEMKTVGHALKNLINKIWNVSFMIEYTLLRKLCQVIENQEKYFDD